MKAIVACLALLQLLAMSGPALAQAVGEHRVGARVVSSESWVEEWDAASRRWVRVAETQASAVPEPATTITTHIRNGVVVAQTRETHRNSFPQAYPQAGPAAPGATRYAQPVAARGAAPILARYGPFVVTTERKAAIIGSTDSASPGWFDAMLRDYPQLAVLEMVEAPGTSNDIANLAVGRRIRAAGLETHVPAGGSVRSGAVELFLAGTRHRVDPGAQFAVHSWLDNHGREADDFAADHAAHRLYLDYYVEMGMSEAQARAFYDMTNSVPHASALWLDAAAMQPWLEHRREAGARVAASRAMAPIHGERAHAPLHLFGGAGRVPLPIATIALEPAHVAIAPRREYIAIEAITLAQVDLSLLDSMRAFP